jgi:hypothetical protein
MPPACAIEEKARMTPSEAIAMAAELNLYVRSIKPDWPNDEERAADLAAHMRLAELFLHAARHRQSSNRDWGANHQFPNLLLSGSFHWVR